MLILAEKIFTIVSLLHYSGGPIVNILTGGVSEGDRVSEPNTEYPIIQIIYFINYVISLLLLALRWQKVINILNKDRHILVMLSLCSFSFLWSGIPQATLIKTVATIGTSLFGIYIATRYSLKEQLRLLAWTFAIAIGLSMIFAIFIPKFGIMSGFHSGALRGIYTHKNSLGKLMVLSTTVFLLAAVNEEKNQFKLWIGFGFSIILLLLSKSSSSVINVCIMLIAYLLIRLLLLNYNLMFPALFLVTIVGQILFLFFNNNHGILLNSMGKDADLTGRTPLWNAVLYMIWQRPWLGYGFGGFWKDWDTPGANIWRIVAWNPMNSHNGLLDLWLELGLFGLALFLIGFALNLVRSLTWIRIYKTAEVFWPVMYMVYFWLSNQTESSLLRQNELFWLLYVTISISMLIPPEKRQSKSKLHDYQSINIA